MYAHAVHFSLPLSSIISAYSIAYIESSCHVLIPASCRFPKSAFLHYIRRLSTTPLIKASAQRAPKLQFADLICSCLRFIDDTGNLRTFHCLPASPVSSSLHLLYLPFASRMSRPVIRSALFSCLIFVAPGVLDRGINCSFRRVCFVDFDSQRHLHCIGSLFSVEL